MRKFALGFWIICAASLILPAQSGRRVEPAPIPPTAPREDPSEYSESKPVAKRPIYRPPVAQNRRPENRTVGTQNESGNVSDDGDVVSVQTNLITIPVSVFDRHGLYIPNLRQSDFKVFEDGEEQEITYFGTSEKPFTVVLLLDTSPSTAYRIEDIQRAAIAFVDQLKEQDRVLVVEFDGNVHVLTEPTSDRQAIYKAIRRADFGGGTSLYDAVNFALMKRLNKVEGRKAIVLFTDGVDTTSSKADSESTLALAEESESLIFPIYYNTFFDNQGSLGGIGYPFPTINFPARGTSARDYAFGRQYLEDLAAYTGGRVFRPEATPGGLSAAFEGIAEELRRQYNIGYIPKKDGTPGQRKQVKVRVNRANLVIRARDSYVIKASRGVKAS